MKSKFKKASSDIPTYELRLPGGLVVWHDLNGYCVIEDSSGGILNEKLFTEVSGDKKQIEEKARILAIRYFESLIEKL